MPNTTTIETTIWGETHSVTMDVAQAAAPVLFCGEMTQYQTASFGHTITGALITHLREEAKAGAGLDEETEAEIEEAVERAEEQRTPKLLRYEDAEELRDATPEEAERSRAAAERDGGVGAISVQIDGQAVTCYVLD